MKISQVWAFIYLEGSPKKEKLQNTYNLLRPEFMHICAASFDTMAQVQELLGKPQCTQLRGGQGIQILNHA